MRRLLSEADERATSKSRALQDRLEEAEKERDKFEHEMLSSSRRTNRQLEELKQRIRDLERETKTLSEDKETLEGKEREWRRRREELEVSYPFGELVMEIIARDLPLVVVKSCSIAC